MNFENNENNQYNIDKNILNLKEKSEGLSRISDIFSNLDEDRIKQVTKIFDGIA